MAHTMAHIMAHTMAHAMAQMITERDESNYHESLVHTTLNYLPDARRVLVIGGGDGGTVTQLLKCRRMVAKSPLARSGPTRPATAPPACSGRPLWA